MNYSPIKCPSCGSGSIVPAEGQRIYCKSCDQYFEKDGKPAARIEPAMAQPEYNQSDWIGSRTFAVTLLVLVVIFLLVLALA
jgi:hypothetical protein